MVWGHFSYYGVGNLVITEDVTLNDERYLNLLFENIEESFDKWRAETFMQDGTPWHRSKAVKEWLQNCAVEYLQDWPANSPDSNPIESMFALMKRELREKDTSSITKLKAAILDKWHSLPNDTLHTLADSF